jgi:transposase
MKLIKRSQVSLQEATTFKTSKLKDLFEEYQRVVNCFIDRYWMSDKLPSKINSEMYKQIDSWLLGKTMKCAGNQAMKILRSAHTNNKKKTYTIYKKIYAKAKSKNKIWPIIQQPWSKWSVGKVFRPRINKPVFDGTTIELNEGLCHIQDSKGASSFDLWIRLGSIFGNRFSLILPTHKHRQYNKLHSNGYELSKSLTLYFNKDQNIYYANLFFHKEVEDAPKTKSKALGIDLGRNKLFACSDGRMLGLDFTKKVQELLKKKKHSKNYNQALKGLKYYIDCEIKKLNLPDYDVIVMEDLINMNYKIRQDRRMNKFQRAEQAHWNLSQIYRRIQDICDENRVLLIKIPPAYTSQRCSSCGATHKESRQGEVYKCIFCGYTCDADYNASLNILHLGLIEESTVPQEQKHSNLDLSKFL